MEPDLLARMDRWLPDLTAGLAEVYADPGLADRVVALLVKAHHERPAHLRARDAARVLRPDWFQLPTTVGYAAYADRFGGDLQGVRARVPYLAELGVSYLHLMPLLKPRPGANDGGYAVMDYRAVADGLGTMDDLAELARTLHEHGISLTLDLVLNHVAREHEWAARAVAGEARYRRYFHLFEDRTEPDRYEQTLPEVFPAFAPGNFSWDSGAGAWVWTTFNTWQWDLDWSNPDVFCEFVEIILFLANQGVDCLRLDAIAFLWKRLGTSCQNQPEVHAITQALRAAARIAAPSLIFKAEAIVGPAQVVEYLGTGRREGRVSDLAYHNSLMVQIWSALASRDCRLLVRSLRQFPAKPTTTAWATYLRCHDDIGWAIDDTDAAAVGWDGHLHRAFLSDFYAGIHPGSFASGEVFQENAATGDRRISGTAASLAGLELALDRQDPQAVDESIARLLCAHAVLFGFGGPPLLYMGDEIGLRNDRTYVLEPAHADDNRWMHRPAMPWDVAARRSDPTTVEGRIFAGIGHLVRTRSALASLHAAVETSVHETGNVSVLAAVRRHAAGTVVQLYNVSERAQTVDTATVTRHGLAGSALDRISGSVVDLTTSGLTLAPYAAWWLTPEPAAAP
jgi:amylosucrase